MQTDESGGTHDTGGDGMGAHEMGIDQRGTDAMGTDADDHLRSRTVRWLAAVLSLTVGAVHFGYAPHHLADDWAHGWFFMVLGAFQVAFAVLVVARPRRWLWWSAALVNAAAIATWVVSRSVGLPFGPQDLRKESAGMPDILCAAGGGTMVWADVLTGKSVPLPDWVRQLAQ